MPKLLLAAVSTLVACASNQSGTVGATEFGDLSNPATRSSPLTELRAACGSGAVLGAATLQRNPYLQQVTTTSTMVGWVSNVAGAHSVEITAPDGRAIASGLAEPDGSARAAGERQLWSQLEALEPDTIYCYRVFVEGQPVTEPIGFRTAPSADSTRTIGVLAFGDSGDASAAQFALREQMETVPYQMMIHTGDLAYDSGTITQIEETVFNVYDGLFRHIPFYPASGNHDYETAQGAPFREVFALPENGDAEKWYSYDWGRIHFVALDTEADYATQAAWLDADLAATTLPWKIIYLHRPPYSSGEHGSDLALRAALAPIVEKHHVQLVLAGHDHNYERMTPQNGVMYVVTGGGGRGTRPVGDSSFTAFSEEVIHYVYLEVGVDELVLHAIDAEGVEFDSVVIPR